VAETEYSTTARIPIETIWDFVQEMDNWAPFVTGYQGHRKHSDTESTWTLKGDVGVLTRTLSFQVHVTEWAGPGRVSFRLDGQSEPMAGEGTFTMEPWEESAPRAPEPRRSLARRIAEAIAGFFYRLVRGRAERAPAAAAPASGATRLTFRLRIDPGGPMAPMINAMIKPMLRPAAEDLANRIMGELERRRDGAP
jgi:carbon monoxide dehydrogenase subunit G